MQCTIMCAGHVPYVLVGAGTASFAAAKAIREKDPKAKVRESSSGCGTLVVDCPECNCGCVSDYTIHIVKL